MASHQENRRMRGGIGHMIERGTKQGDSGVGAGGRTCLVGLMHAAGCESQYADASIQSSGPAGL